MDAPGGASPTGAASVRGADAAKEATRGRVALVHEKFTIYAGSEKVVEQIHLMFPDAPIYCSVCDPATLGGALADADVRTSPLQRLYRGGDNYAHLLPLLPWAATHHDLSGYDLVITSHHQFANRVRPDAAATVVSYVHSPARWMWDPAMRAEESGGTLGRAALSLFARTQQRADRRAAQRPQRLVANSHEVANRIARWWGRSADVIAPPVNVDFYRFDPTVAREDFFLLAGRLVPYKRPEVAVAAAAQAGVRLVVAGDGRARAACEAVAGPKTEFIGTVDDATLRDLYRRCRALLYPGREDFGIVPVEAQSCGAPVVAVAAGGALDTVEHGVSGVLYGAGPGEIGRLTTALRSFDDGQFDHGAIAASAARYSPERFRAEFARAVAAEPPG